MYHACIENNFQSWRAAARRFLLARVDPDEILWTTAAQSSLFHDELPVGPIAQNIKVPREFFELAGMVAYYDSPEKWALLYRTLYRLTYRNKNLLQIESDPDVREVKIMAKAVKRDIHKFHAFVRFRKVEVEGREIYIAWHEPHHYTVEPATPFFARRFGSMLFSILTPRGCAHWDLKELRFSEGVSREMAPKVDIAEDFWLTYYRSIFNPFRLKVKAMKKEFPVRHWRTLPEAVLIPELIRNAK
jgi:DNA polymerase